MRKAGHIHAFLLSRRLFRILKSVLLSLKKIRSSEYDSGEGSARRRECAEILTGVEIIFFEGFDSSHKPFIIIAARIVRLTHDPPRPVAQPLTQ